MNAASRDPFLSALAGVAADRLGEDHPCALLAAEAAAAPGSPVEAELRAAIDGLDPDTRDGLMAELHRRMREDLSSIWDHLPGYRQTRPN